MSHLPKYKYFSLGSYSSIEGKKRLAVKFQSLTLRDVSSRPSDEFTKKPKWMNKEKLGELIGREKRLTAYKKRFYLEVFLKSPFLLIYQKNRHQINGSGILSCFRHEINLPF